MIISINFLYI